LSALADESYSQLERAKVSIRIISLDGAPDGFASLITRNNNTQNKIDPRNFVALDPQQERIKAEFLVDGIDYEFRQGEIEHSSTNRLGLVEATIALACTDDDLALSVQSKREVGRLWEDIERAPYKKLFNGNRSSEFIWQRVIAFRRIDSEINSISTKTNGKKKNIAIHGNRLLAHLSYRDLVKTSLCEDLSDKSDSEIKETVNIIFTTLLEDVNENYQDNYVASLFKNLSKCREMSSRVLAKLADKN